GLVIRVQPGKVQVVVIELPVQVVGGEVPARADAATLAIAANRGAARITAATRVAAMRGQRLVQPLLHGGQLLAEGRHPLGRGEFLRPGRQAAAQDDEARNPYETRHGTPSPGVDARVSRMLARASAQLGAPCLISATPRSPLKAIAADLVAPGASGLVSCAKL